MRESDLCFSAGPSVKKIFQKPWFCNLSEHKNSKNILLSKNWQEKKTTEKQKKDKPFVNKNRHQNTDFLYFENVTAEVKKNARKKDAINFF